MHKNKTPEQISFRLQCEHAFMFPYMELCNTPMLALKTLLYSCPFSFIIYAFDFSLTTGWILAIISSLVMR